MGWHRPRSPGAGTALVGSNEQVAERLFEYYELGLDEFILSGHPHLEEAYAVGEGVLPLLGDRKDVDLPDFSPWRIRYQKNEPAAAL